MESWHAKGCQQLLQSAQQQQQPLDLSTPFRPAALLNALEQQACREAGVALGQLKLASYWGSGGGSRVANMGASKPPFTVLASGLLLQGALFDGYSLQPVQQVRCFCALGVRWLLVSVCVALAAANLFETAYLTTRLASFLKFFCLDVCTVSLSPLRAPVLSLSVCSTPRWSRLCLPSA